MVTTGKKIRAALIPALRMIGMSRDEGTLALYCWRGRGVQTEVLFLEHWGFPGLTPW